MSDLKVLALFQQLLGVTAQERGVLEDLVCQRLITAGMTVSNAGVIATTVPLAAAIDPANLTSAVPVAKGGTGAVTLTGLVKGSGTSAMTAVAAPTGAVVGDTDTQTLTGKTIAGASNTLTVRLANDVSGTLPVTNGGLGVATLGTAYGLVAAGTTATGAVQTISPGTAGQILTSNGAGVLPSMQAAPASGLAPVYTAKTANYTAVANDLVACTSGTFTVTLPAAASNANKGIWVVNNGTGTITIGRTGADTIGLATSQTANAATASAQGDSFAFLSDGVSNWNIV